MENETWKEYIQGEKGFDVDFNKKVDKRTLQRGTVAQKYHKMRT